MNPEFKVLTNVGETKSRTPLIQNRFRKLTLQSPQQSNIKPKTPDHKTMPQSKLATENNVNQSTTPIRSQSQVITNKLMLSTSSNALTETNFINVETEPFSNPLQVESTDTDNVQKSPKPKSDNGELTSRMEKLEVSRMSAELFSQGSSSSKISLPPNRILSNKENIDNLSQRMSNIRMSDLAETQPNTPFAHKSLSRSPLADTQPNTAPHRKNQLEHSAVTNDERIIASIVLSSDDEDNNDGSNNPRKSLLTEESDDVSVIEIVSSDDSLEESDDRVPENNLQKSAINAEVDELTESVAQKLNNFFDNIPKLDQSRQNFYKNVESNASPNKKSDTSEIDIPETVPSDGKKNCDESNVLELEASQLDESGNVSGNKDNSKINSSNENDVSGNNETSQASMANENEGNKKNDTLDSSSDRPEDASLHGSLHSPVLQLNESRKTFDEDNESENRLIEDESGNADSSNRNRSTDEKQLSVREPKKKIQFEKIKTNAIKVINSPTINVSATININIQVSGFSSNSSDTDATSENTEDPSDKSSKNDASLQSEDVIDSSMELVSHCRRNNANQLYQSDRLIVYSPNVNKATDLDVPDQDDQMSPDTSVIESSIIVSAKSTPRTPRSISAEKETGNVFLTSVVAKESDDASICSADAKESTDVSSSSADVAARDSINVSTTSGDVDGKESINESTSSADLAPKESAVDNGTKDDNILSVTPTDTSIEIDEIGEQLLNGIYGDTWRTPQLIKKCVSTKKKYQTDVIKRGKSRGFSLFRRDLIHSELDSTRITPTCAGTEKSVCKEPLDESQSDSEVPDKDMEDNKSDANQSSRIKRTRRKAAPNRILDFSDDDGEDKVDDDKDSDQSFKSSDNSFEPESSGESDSSVEVLEQPHPVRRKRKNFVFLDLTCNEVIEDEDHENPDATSEELEKVVENYLQSLKTDTIVQTPAPAKKNVPSNTTKRKLFTPNYDDQTPFEETETPEPVTRNNEKKTIQLKTPIPSYLIPPQFRDKAKIVTDPVTPTGVPPSKDSKKSPTPYTPAPKTACGFLESLDSKLIPEKHCDPEALRLRSNFKRHRNELVKRLMSIFNTYVFDNRLKDVPVTWSKRLTTAGGICRQRKISGARKCFIELSEKVLTSADRVRNTLIHELCHAATWIIDREAGGHGKIWKYWTNRANKRFPELPLIERCHNYDIVGKYTYKCTICGLKARARSKSKKVENIRCAKCHGPIEVFLNKTDKDGQVILVPPKEPSMFAKYVQKEYKMHKVSGATHADVMKILSNNFGKLTVEEKSKYK